MGARAGEASGFIHVGSGAGAPAASGCFVFLGEESTIGPAAEAALTDALGASGGALLVWAPRAADLAADSATRLSFDAQGRLSSPGAVMAGGVRVQLADDVHVRVEPGALVLEGSVDAADGSRRFTTRGRVRVPLEGPEAGALEVDLDAAPVEASFRYFWGPQGGLSRAAYPVFDTPPRQPLRLRAHPHRGRAELRVRADDGAARYATTFRTPFGHPVLLGLTDTSGFAYQYDPVAAAAYPVLDGAWTVHGTGATAGLPLDVMLGTSGIEYARLADGAPVAFAPGNPAYAPYFDTTASGASALTSAAPGVSEPVTTSWLAVPGPRAAGPVGLAGALPGYFSQPERSPFYEIAEPKASFLSFLPVDAGIFPTAAFPAVPYAGLAADAPVGAYARLEVEVLGTVRRNVLLLGPAREAAEALARTRAAAAAPALGATGACHGPTGPLGPAGDIHAAVTPRGLLAGFDTASGGWRELQLLQADHGRQSLRLTGIESPLRGALLSNQLFLVATDREKLLRACSIEYQLTEHSYAVLSAMGPEQAALARCTRYLQGFVYESLPYFDAVLRVAIGDEAMKTYGPVFHRVAARAQFVVRDWTFDLSPYLWSDNQTVLIFKYAELPLDRLVADTSLWTAQDAFLAEPIGATQKKLTAFLADAARRAETDPDFRYFSETVARDRRVGGGVEAWNGVVCLNCAVPLTRLPPQLQGLAAGIDPAGFRAHHVGINASAISAEGGVLAIEDSSVFGLIAYENPGDLSYRGQPYEYKVLLLKVLFASSQVTGFASQIELLVGALFGERSSLPSGQHGDNLVLNGIWQRRGDVDSYSFTEQGDDLFQVASEVIDTVTIRRAEFSTVLPDDQATDRTVQTRFLLGGTLRFKALPGFDLFSFGDAQAGGTQGGLPFTNLAIRMDFDPLALPAKPPTFAFDAGQISLDPATGRVRDGSFYQRFPLRLDRMVQGSGSDTPDALGFMRVYTPLAAGSVSGHWFGLVMDLNLGSQGGLAARAGFFASFIAAWAPGGEGGYQVWVGLQLPGATGAERALTIMGPLKLKMADLQLLVLDADRPGQQSYLLKLANITLSFLSVSLPPGGKVNALLFGNPDPNATGASLGWYAAYAKDAEKKEAATEPRLVPLAALGAGGAPAPRTPRRVRRT